MTASTLARVPGTLAPRSPGVLTDADLYAFGLWVGARSLFRSPVEGLKSLLFPVEYIRCAESRYVLGHLELERGHSVLDIGSPKLPSLFLAARLGVRVHATDLVDYFFQRYGAYAEAVLSGERRDLYRMEVQDARHLTYPDQSFDRVFSISAIEHIADSGDAEAISEIARVLRPGGLACLTVPWGLAGYVEEFHPANPSFYWAQGAPGESLFYQRAYDRKTLESRLLRDPRLELVDLSFVGERLPVEHYILSRRLGGVVRYSLLPFHFYLSRCFVSPMTESEACRKKVACLTLRRR